MAQNVGIMHKDYSGQYLPEGKNLGHFSYLGHGDQLLKFKFVSQLQQGDSQCSPSAWWSYRSVLLACEHLVYSADYLGHLDLLLKLKVWSSTLQQDVTSYSKNRFHA